MNDERDIVKENKESRALRCTCFHKPQLASKTKDGHIIIKCRSCKRLIDVTDL